jgi:hypothetical protein
MKLELGRGEPFLRAERVDLGALAQLDELELALPEGAQLAPGTPFRARLRKLRLRVNEQALAALLSTRCALSLNVSESGAELALAASENTFVTASVGLVEYSVEAGSDRLRLAFDAIRAWGPAPCYAPPLLHEQLRRCCTCDELRPRQWPRFDEAELWLAPVKLLLSHALGRSAWPAPYFASSCRARVGLAARQLLFSIHDPALCELSERPLGQPWSRLSPSSHRQEVWAADTAAQEGELATAIELLEELQRREGGQPASSERLLVLYHLQGRYSSMQASLAGAGQSLTAASQSYCALQIALSQNPAQLARCLSAFLEHEAAERVWARAAASFLAASLETEPQRAASGFEHVSRFEPFAERALERLQLLYQAMGEAQLQISALQRTAQRQTLEPERRLALARAYLQLGDQLSAERHLARLLEERTLSAEQTAEAARAFAPHAPQLAFEAASAAIQLAEEAQRNPAPFLEWAAQLALEALAQPATARALCERALQTEPASSSALHLLLRATLQQHDFDAAERAALALERAQAPLELLVEAWRLLARALRDRAEQVEPVRQQGAWAPPHPALVGGSPTGAQVQRHWQLRAELAWQRLILLSPWDEEAFESLCARASAQQIKLWLEKRVQTAPDAAHRLQAIMALSSLLAERLGERQAALEWLESALSIAPHDAHLLALRQAWLTPMAGAPMPTESLLSGLAAPPARKDDPSKPSTGPSRSAQVHDPTPLSSVEMVLPDSAESGISSAPADVVSQEVEISVQPASFGVALHLGPLENEDSSEQELASFDAPQLEQRALHPRESSSGGGARERTDAIAPQPESGDPQTQGQVVDNLQKSASVFVPPDPRQAPDWRQAAQQWLSRSKRTGIASDTPAEAERNLAGEELEGFETNLRAPTQLTPRVPDRDVLKRQAESARHAGRHRELLALLAALLEFEESPRAQSRLLQEMGCVAYFELDEPALARTHLLRATELDPQGAFLEAETLTVLEGIFEQNREYERLHAVYLQKLLFVDSTEMRQVYRLLLAQLCFEQLERPEEAWEHIDEVLEALPEHEPALLLMSEVERALGRFDDAALRLEKLLTVGELESGRRVELLLELGRIYEEAGDFDDAKRALLRALRYRIESPRVLARLKSACRKNDDWEGLLELLRRDLAEHLGLDPSAFATPGADEPSSSWAETPIVEEQDEPLELHARGIDLSRITAAELELLSSRQVVSTAQLLREIADVLSLKLGRSHDAWLAYGLILELTPEDAYVLERRLELGRQLEEWGPFLRDVERMVQAMLNPREQFELLCEGARTARSKMADSLRARSFLERAVKLFEGKATRPTAFDKAVEELEALSRGVVTQFSLGSRASSELSPTEMREGSAELEGQAQELGGTGEAPHQQELGGTDEAPNQQEFGGTDEAPNQQEVEASAALQLGARTRTLEPHRADHRLAGDELRRASGANEAHHPKHDLSGVDARGERAGSEEKQRISQQERGDEIVSGELGILSGQHLGPGEGHAGSAHEALSSAQDDEPEMDPLSDSSIMVVVEDTADTPNGLAQVEQALALATERSSRVRLLNEKALLLLCWPGREPDAQLALRAALALEPKHMGARLSLIDLLLSTGELEQALNHLVALVQHLASRGSDGPRLQSEEWSKLRSLLDVLLLTEQATIISRARMLERTLNTLSKDGEQGS